jgi:hypothetical protein
MYNIESESDKITKYLNMDLGTQKQIVTIIN